jgi:hypothetical protein
LAGFFTQNVQHAWDFLRIALEDVESGKLANGDVLIGHRSAQASHPGIIAYLRKRRQTFDPVREEILPL